MRGRMCEARVKLDNADASVSWVGAGRVAEKTSGLDQGPIMRTAACVNIMDRLVSKERHSPFPAGGHAEGALAHLGQGTHKAKTNL